jgi:hypothetical protein
LKMLLRSNSFDLFINAIRTLYCRIKGPAQQSYLT